MRDATLRAGLERAQAAAEGCVAAFTGSGGSGTTTLAAAVALLAAQRGRYVSVLDLSRPFSVLAFLLDVEPAAGLEQLLDATQGTGPDPDLVDAVRAKRSERIAVYAHRFGPEPAAAPDAEAVLRLVAELGRRSHLVVVDGLDDGETRFSVLAAAQRRVLVVEPTPSGAARGARVLERLGDGASPVVVRNHTRPLSNDASLRTLRRAGWRTRPRVFVPFEPELPALCDRGWPKDQLPNSLKQAVSTLSDVLLPAPGRGSPSTVREGRAELPSPRAKPGRSSGHTDGPRRRWSPGAWWSRPRGARPRPA